MSEHISPAGPTANEPVNEPANEPADEPAAAEVDRRRRSFGPVVLLGLAFGGLAAVAGHKPWAQTTGSEASQLAAISLSAELGEMPAAGALALVCLACWGVLLVTRGRVRRVVAVLALLAALGVLVTAVLGFTGAVDDVRSAFEAVGTTGFEVSRTGWYWAGLVGALGSVALSALAVRLVPAWPEMGSKYDAPGAGPTPEPAVQEPLEERSSIDLWKAMDEGQDPTA